MLWLLLFALVAVSIGGIVGLPVVMATGVVTAIVAITALKCPSRLLLAAFWIWLEGILLYLLFAAHDRTLSVFGLPRPALVMLAGLWLAPILLWPLGFALTYKKWTGRE
ncbi:MAG: hypothetical protein EHM18_06890 [Acidobacteria bacterium]|nr:MAG: hypothetical protein EHM18_06890 [Acidobacteriota bacterium]